MNKSNSHLNNKILKLGLIVSLMLCLSKFANAETNQNNITQIPKSATAVWNDDARKKCALYGEKFNNNEFAPISKNINKNKLSEILENGQNGYIVGDFNGDKKNDYIIITTNSGCVQQSTLLNNKADKTGKIGQSGPINHFIISNSTSYSVFDGFSAWLSQSQIKRNDNVIGRDVLEITNGGYSGKCGEIHKVIWGWDGKKIDLLERRNKNGQKINGDGCLLQIATKQPAINIVPTNTTAIKNSKVDVIKPSEKLTTKAAVNIPKKNNPQKNSAKLSETTQRPNLPPITPGYYAYQISCSQAVEKSSKDKPSDFIGLFNDKYWAYFYENGTPWGNTKIEKVDNLENNQYRLKLRTYGNGNDKKGNARNTTLNILSATKFTLTENGYSNTYNHCPASKLPDWLKAHFEIRD